MRMMAHFSANRVTDQADRGLRKSQAQILASSWLRTCCPECTTCRKGQLLCCRFLALHFSISATASHPTMYRTQDKACASDTAPTSRMMSSNVLPAMISLRRCLNTALTPSTSSGLFQERPLMPHTTPSLVLLCGCFALVSRNLE